jgi:hypothetical protein
MSIATVDHKRDPPSIPSTPVMRCVLAAAAEGGLPATHFERSPRGHKTGVAGGAHPRASLMQGSPSRTLACCLGTTARLEIASARGCTPPALARFRTVPQCPESAQSDLAGSAPRGRRRPSRNATPLLSSPKPALNAPAPNARGAESTCGESDSHAGRACAFAPSLPSGFNTLHCGAVTRFSVPIQGN